MNRRSFLALAPLSILVAPELPKRAYSFLWERSPIERYQAFYEAIAQETVRALGAIGADDYIFVANPFDSAWSRTAFGRIGLIEALLDETIITRDTAIDLLTTAD
jgi:hypothetical protein